MKFATRFKPMRRKNAAREHAAAAAAAPASHGVIAKVRHRKISGLGGAFLLFIH
jgi:hypothetical protein